MIYEDFCTVFTSIATTLKFDSVVEFSLEVV